MAFIDNQGATRHQMTREELDDLYCMLCNFIADCTSEEVKQVREHVVGIKTLIHQRMLDN